MIVESLTLLQIKQINDPTCYYYWKCNLVSAIFYCHHIYCFISLNFLYNVR